MAQPPLSVQIRDLERELGGCLFDRQGRGVKLTRVGEGFLKDARAILRASETAKAAVRDEVEGRMGAVALGYQGSYLPARVCKRLRKFERSYRGVRIVLTRVRDAEEAIGRFDGFIGLFSRDGLPAGALPVEESVISLLVHRKHRLADRDGFVTTDLIGETLLLPDDGSWRALEKCVQGGLPTDLELEKDFRAHDAMEILLLAQCGAGVGLVPDGDIVLNGWGGHCIVGNPADLSVMWAYVPCSGDRNSAEGLLRGILCGG